MISSVGILGGGLMGAGIAQVAARAGLPTVCREISEALTDKARETIETSLAKAIEKGKLNATERDTTMAAITFTTDLAQVAACDIVIEAIVEDLTVKNALWRELDALAPPGTIFASNTSSLSIVAMASVTGRRDRFLGMHFFNPVPQMKLVEIVRTVTTSDATMRSAFDLSRRMGKEPIAARDTPGFVVNLLLVPYMLDAIRALENGVGSIADIDIGMQLGAGHPMGPLALCDFVGLDTLERVAEIMYGEYRERRYAPPPLLRRMVIAQLLGRKNGHGFYEYASETPVPSVLGV